jgi:hypothetical protein
MASKGRQIDEIVIKYNKDILNLEKDIITTFNDNIVELKDNIISELKSDLESKGFKIYVQWIKKYKTLEHLTDFSFNERFLCKLGENWYYIIVKDYKMFINSKEFRKFATIDMNKVWENVDEKALFKLGYEYDKINNQLILKDKDNCYYSHLYESHIHTDYSRIYKLNSLLNE